MDAFTVLPIQIFNWTSRPQEDFRSIAAAGIIVLLILLLTMNALAVFLRNKYQPRRTIDAFPQGGFEVENQRRDQRRTRGQNDREDLRVYYGDYEALKGISMGIKANRVTAFIGPSGCGKSTFLRTLNRMNDLIEGVRITGSIKLDGIDIYSPDSDVVDLRKRVGMVFQRPNPFPKSIFENVVYGPRRYGIKNRRNSWRSPRRASSKRPSGTR